MAKIEPRYETVHLAPPHDAVELVIRANPPMGVFEEFASGELARQRPALAKIVRSSNLEDDDGPIDLATATGWLRVDLDTLKVAADAILKVISPKSTGTTTPSSAPSSLAEVVASPQPTTAP